MAQTDAQKPLFFVLGPVYVLEEFFCVFDIFYILYVPQTHTHHMAQKYVEAPFIPAGLLAQEVTH